MEPQSYYYMRPIQPEWLPRGLLGTLIAARCVSYVRVHQKGPLLRDQCLFFPLRGQRAAAAAAAAGMKDESRSDSCTLNKEELTSVAGFWNRTRQNLFMSGV